MRKRLAVISVAAFASVFGAAACGAAQDEIRNRAQDEVDRQRQRVEKEVQRQRDRAEDRVRQEVTRAIEGGQQ